MAASGLRFVSIRATEGSTYKDPKFPFNWAGAHAAGMFRTAYHFAHPNLPAAAQADFFVDTVAAAGGYAAGTNTTQFMLDLEDANGLAPPAVWAWVQAFIAQLKARTGKPAIIYVGYYFWRDSVGNPASNLDAPLWIASRRQETPSAQAPRTDTPHRQAHKSATSEGHPMHSKEKKFPLFGSLPSSPPTLNLYG